MFWKLNAILAYSIHCNSIFFLSFALKKNWFYYLSGIDLVLLSCFAISSSYHFFFHFSVFHKKNVKTIIIILFDKTCIWLFEMVAFYVINCPRSLSNRFQCWMVQCEWNSNAIQCLLWQFFFLFAASKFKALCDREVFLVWRDIASCVWIHISKV